MQTPVGSEPAKSRAHGALLPLLQAISSLRTKSLGESLCLCLKFKPVPETLWGERVPVYWSLRALKERNPRHRLICTLNFKNGDFKKLREKTRNKAREVKNDCNWRQIVWSKNEIVISQSQHDESLAPTPDVSFLWRHHGKLSCPRLSPSLLLRADVMWVREEELRILQKLVYCFLLPCRNQAGGRGLHLPSCVNDGEAGLADSGDEHQGP